jgi:hypothetical protein
MLRQVKHAYGCITVLGLAIMKASICMARADNPERRPQDPVAQLDEIPNMAPDGDPQERSLDRVRYARQVPGLAWLQLCGCLAGSIPLE